MINRKMRKQIIWDLIEQYEIKNFHKLFYTECRIEETDEIDHSLKNYLIKMFG